MVEPRVVDDVAADHGGDEVQVVGQQHEVGPGPGRERAADRVAEDGRRRGGRGVHRRLRRAAGEGDEVAHALVHGQVAAGQRAVGQADAVVVDGDLGAAERLRPGGIPRAADRVGDDREALAEGALGHRHDVRVHVDAVGDEPDVQPLVGQRHAGQPRLAVVQRRHGVEEVRDPGGAGVDGGGRLGVRWPGCARARRPPPAPRAPRSPRGRRAGRGRG